jgi:dipeptidyl aminopeptidase/acylaminoacyl peptidase
MAVRRTRIGTTVQACVAVLVCAVVASCNAATTAVRATQPASPSATHRATSAAALDPLTIPAMRERTYPASVLTFVRSDGDQGGFVSSIVSYQSDGLTEYALLSVPDGVKPSKGWPVIVLNHGYINPATYRTDDASYAEFIAAFARAGYMVVKPDYRGHGMSEGVADGGHLSPVYAYDVLNLISTLAADPRVDSARIGLFGHSMGGHEALRVMVVSSQIKAAVFMAGVVGSFYDFFYNWPQRHEPPDLPASMRKAGNAVIAVHGTPISNPSFWDAASAINYVSATTAAVQIDQDVDDSVVPKTFADHLEAALMAAGKDVEYRTYPGDDHQFVLNRQTALANMVRFYQQHL